MQPDGRAVIGTDHEAAAVKAAADVIAGQRKHLWDVDFCEVQALARAIIEAAREHIAAAERERCAELADRYSATYEPCDCPECQKDWHPQRFADLLRQDDSNST